MKIIADIGATNSRWMIDDKRFDTSGYNPNTHDRSVWQGILDELPVDHAQPVDIVVYGAGFSPVWYDQLKQDIQHAFPNVNDMTLAEDLLGACHGMAGNREGIIVIMGTGSNTCHYDGNSIVRNIRSLGYILGDEGSAVHIGKHLVRAYIHGKMPDHLMQAFDVKYPEGPDQIIKTIYQTRGNQYLGQFAKFAHENKDDPFMAQLVEDCLTQMLDILADYKAPHLPHYFTGSIAVHFEDTLRQLCADRGIHNVTIVPDYLDGLAKYCQE